MSGRKIQRVEIKMPARCNEGARRVSGGPQLFQVHPQGLTSAHRLQTPKIHGKTFGGSGESLAHSWIFVDTILFLIMDQQLDEV